MMDPRKKMAPMGSNRAIVCRQLRSDATLLCFLGEGRSSNRPRTATAPHGTLIQKHQRQVTREVKAPPIRGPTTDEMAYIPTTTDEYAARFSGSVVWMMAIKAVRLVSVMAGSALGIVYPLKMCLRFRSPQWLSR